jgi:hypothetical protein
MSGQHTRPSHPVVCFSLSCWSQGRTQMGAVSLHTNRPWALRGTSRETITNRGLMRPGAETGPCDAPIFLACCRILLRFPLADRLPTGGQPWLATTSHYASACEGSVPASQWASPRFVMVSVFDKAQNQNESAVSARDTTHRWSATTRFLYIGVRFTRALSTP